MAMPYKTNWIPIFEPPLFKLWTPKYDKTGRDNDAIIKNRDVTFGKEKFIFVNEYDLLDITAINRKNIGKLIPVVIVLKPSGCKMSKYTERLLTNRPKKIRHETLNTTEYPNFSSDFISLKFNNSIIKYPGIIRKKARGNKFNNGLL
jgi:hypothetical protein